MPRAPSPTGNLFGKYELVEQLGRGGMAEVWKAKIHGIAGFERTLVIKRILPQLVRDEEFVAMFVREAQLCSMLSHVNIVQVFELGELDGEYYMAMEYVPGRDLHAIMRAHVAAPPPGLAAVVGADVARALGYAHGLTDAAGVPLRIVHRDVTPSNVMLGIDGMVKLVDFGVAKALAIATSALTAAGSIKGKLSYMAPEQMTGGTIDHRTDLFACGITLHETLTGRRLFKGDNDEQTIQKALQAPIPAPSQINPAVPRDLDLVVMKALEREPARRFQSGEEMAAALETCAHKLKWGSAQVASLMEKFFPELASAPTGHATSSVSLPRSQASGRFADLPTAFAPTRLGKAPGQPEPTQHRGTLALVRAVDQMGAWTADEPIPTPLDPGPTRIAPLTEPPTASEVVAQAIEGSRSPALRRMLAVSIVLFGAAVTTYLLQRRHSVTVEAMPIELKPISPVAPATATRPAQPKPPSRPSADVPSRKNSDDDSLAPKVNRPIRASRLRTRANDAPKPAPATKPAHKADVERGDVIDPF